MPRVQIDKEFRALIPPLSEEEHAQLEENILRDGCRDPLVVWGDLLLDGHNRLEICEHHELSYDTKGVDLDSRDAAKVWIINNQFGRRNLAPYQRIELAIIRESLLPSEQGKRTDLGQKSDRSGGKPHREAAKLAGVSHDTYAKGKVIAEKAPEETKAKLRKGELTINKAYTDIKRGEYRATKIEELQQTSKPLNGDMGRFPVVLADPPWQYEHVKTESRAIENQYPTMSLQEIHDLDVEEITTPDAVLFLWTTSPKLAEAISVIIAWEFNYRTCMVWVKDKIGMGYYARQQHELLLIATRGNPPTPAPEDRPPSVFNAKRGRHSAKPKEVYALIEQMYPDLPKVELFARKTRAGWKAWGNESGT